MTDSTRVFPTAAQLGAPPVAYHEADLSTIRIYRPRDDAQRERLEELRRRGGSKALWRVVGPILDEGADPDTLDERIDAEMAGLSRLPGTPGPDFVYLLATARQLAGLR